MASACTLLPHYIMICSLLVKIDPEFRSRLPVLSLVLRLHECVYIPTGILKSETHGQQILGVQQLWSQH